MDLSWNGPTSDVNGQCLTNLGGFLVQWGNVSGGPYPNSLDVGLPCTPGKQVACDGGFANQLDCSFPLVGLPTGSWYIAVVDYNLQGVESVPSQEISDTNQCACDGCACAAATDCPPFQMCDTGAGVCDRTCAGAGCLCDADSQCVGNSNTGLGQGEICVGGVCAAGCNAATDCPPGFACDLTGGAPGVCLSGCTGSSCACVTDQQCSGGDGGQEFVCGPGQLCVSGCKTGFDCPGSAACDQSLGVVASCETLCSGSQCSCVSSGQCTDGDAGLGLLCFSASGLCGAGCAVGADCGPTQGCDTATSACTSSCATVPGCACVADAQCNAGLSGQGVICSGNSCLAGCNSDADCDAGSCNLTQSPGTCG